MRIRSQIGAYTVVLATLWLPAGGARAAAAQEQTRTAQSTARTMQEGAHSPGRWIAQDEVFYQIFVRSFRDSNGDHIGDLAGIQQELGYLQKLGVTSLLLTPICPSPFYHNYFCTSFAGVEPAYGDPGSLARLARAVHARGMKLYLDEEFQYVAEGHPWWAQSQGNPASKYSRYIPYHGPGNTKPEPAVFNLTTTATWDGRNIGLATVNLSEPAVQVYFDSLLVSLVDPNGDGRFDDGVDGFRLDHMMDDLDSKGIFTHLFADFWAPIMAGVRAVNPRVRFIAEQADWGYGDDYLTRGGADMNFAFPLFGAIASLNGPAIAGAITHLQEHTPAGKGRLIFIENHDVTRFATQVAGDPRKERIGAALDILLKGTPLIYYGQEIGMKGRREEGFTSDGNDIPDREAFKWTRRSDGPGAATWYRGFGPWWSQRYNRDDDGVSVQEEQGNPKSLLSFYRQLLALRRARPELRGGDEHILPTGRKNVLVILRSTPAQASLLLVNLGRDSATVRIAAAALPPTLAGTRLTDLLTGRPATAAGHPLRVELEPFGVSLLGRR